jgi:hypothetical protein
MRCTGVLYRRTEDTGQSFLSILAIGSCDIDRALASTTKDTKSRSAQKGHEELRSLKGS